MTRSHGGTCCIQEDEETRRVRVEIEKQLQQARAERDKTIKILLLGTGGAGKSTVIKQMRIIHKEPITDSERMRVIPYIHSNLLEAISVLSRFIPSNETVFHEPYLELELEKLIDRQFSDLKNALFEEDLKIIWKIWTDPGMRNFVENRKDIPFDEPHRYFLNKIPSLLEEGYKPDDDDFLRVRKRTTVIQEYPVQVDKVIYRFVDVGGQRTERRKWMHCFENVDAVMFIAAISAYDQKTEEDPDVNAMLESVKLFKLIVSEDFKEYFKRTAIILFLNKIDVFRNKVAFSDLCNHFPEFKGRPKDPEAAEQFILDMYLDCNKDQKRDIYTHFTCATDTEGMKFAMTAVEVYLTRAALKDVIRF